MPDIRGFKVSGTERHNIKYKYVYSRLYSRFDVVIECYLARAAS